MVILAFLLLGATGVIYWASSNVNHSVYWADRICTDAQALCNSPWWLLVATGAVIVIGLFGRAMKT